jgi:hypothetical protein
MALGKRYAMEGMAMGPKLAHMPRPVEPPRPKGTSWTVVGWTVRDVLQVTRGGGCGPRPVRVRARDLLDGLRDLPGLAVPAGLLHRRDGRPQGGCPLLCRPRRWHCIGRGESARVFRLVMLPMLTLKIRDCHMSGPPPAVQGPITRIASGCDDEKAAALTGLYSKLGAQFQLHVTPDFSIDKITGAKYVFYNKPGGLQHWLSSDNSPPAGTIVALIDPDMVFMRPLTNKIRSEPFLVTSPVKEADLMEEVAEGRPAAQFYGIGDKWIEFNLSYIAGPDSPSLRVDSNTAWSNYSIGPPYLVHKNDLTKIANLWHDFVPRSGRTLARCP